MVLLTEIRLPPIARQGAACLVSTRGQAREARTDKFAPDEGFQPYSIIPPSEILDSILTRKKEKHTKQ